MDKTEMKSILETVEDALRDHELDSLANHVSRAIHSLESAEAVDFADYDPGLLNDYGGGNVEWWQDYIRYVVNGANDFWREQVEAIAPQPPKVEAEADGGAVGSLIGAVRAVNRSPHHRVNIEGDDEPCYWQRAEWVDYVLDLATKAEQALLTASPAQEGGWVKCSERLPTKADADPCHNVWAINADHPESVPVLKSYRDFELAPWLTHWMPTNLPAPPTEGE